MNIKKLGIEWGAAYQEAQPIAVRTPNARLVMYEAEGGELVIETLCRAQLTSVKGLLTIRFDE